MSTNGKPPPPLEDNLSRLSDEEWRQLDAGRERRRALVLGDVASSRPVWIRAAIQAVLLAVASGLAVYVWTDEAWIAVVGGAGVAVAGHVVVEVSMRIVRRRTP
jgi:hypothetical protein